MRYIVIALTLMLSACAGTAQLEERTRTALEATNAAIDPAYAAATEGCIVRVQAIERAYDQGFKPAYDAANELESVHKQCNKTRSVFATIRTLYNEAVKLYNDGRFAEALAAYADITRAWASLNGGTK